ncbi:hypothetical protein ACEQ8H_006049 [Pleosporales sp. CAS-2024a]
MSKLYADQKEQATPPSSFADTPLTPPPTDKKSSAQAQQVVAFFRDREAGKDINQDWIAFRVAPEEYAEIERLLSCDEALSGYVENKIRYDYDLENHQLVVRMPTRLHEFFLDGVEYAIRRRLETIRSGTGDAARFAGKVRTARSTEIFFPVENGSPDAKSKYEPDTSFWHDDAKYPGIIIEVAYSQRKKKLDRLAENYLLDSKTNVQVVVGLDIEYGKKEPSKATFTIWRVRVVGDELRVVKEVEDEAFRDEQGNPTMHPGLQFHLSDFACKRLTKDIIGCIGGEVVVSTHELCQHLEVAEANIKRQDALLEDHIPHGLKMRRRSMTPGEEVTSSDEAEYVAQAEKAMKRVADEDPDYNMH